MEPRQMSGESLSLPQPLRQEQAAVPPLEIPGASTTEVASGRNEQTERRLGQQVEAMGRMPAPTPIATASPTSLPAPLPPPVASTPAVQASSDDDTPIVAGDEDLIEKEWVDKAKKVISSTKDDPYRREQEVKKLQVEYLRKRYGREIGNDDEQ